MSHLIYVVVIALMNKIIEDEGNTGVQTFVSIQQIIWMFFYQFIRRESDDMSTCKPLSLEQG